MTDLEADSHGPVPPAREDDAKPGPLPAVGEGPAESPDSGAPPPSSEAVGPGPSIGVSPLVAVLPPGVTDTVLARSPSTGIADAPSESNA